VSTAALGERLLRKPCGPRSNVPFFFPAPAGFWGAFARLVAFFSSVILFLFRFLSLVILKFGIYIGLLGVDAQLN
jgi:hypothetical protein